MVEDGHGHHGRHPYGLEMTAKDRALDEFSIQREETFMNCKAYE